MRGTIWRAGRLRPHTGRPSRRRARRTDMLGYVTDSSAPAGIARREMPEPRPGPADVLVEVAAYGINRGELSLIERRPDGWTPGQDVAGVVAAAAADGTGPQAGTRVVGMADWGGWSER